MKLAEDKKADVVASMEEEGYEFYKAHGSNWYFFQVNKVGDSACI